MIDSGTQVDGLNTNGGDNSAKRALRAIRDLKAEVDALRGAMGQPIAIIGMGCRFPGAEDLSAFWQMLCEKRDGIREVPPERWSASHYFHPDHKVPGKIAGRWGGFLDGLDSFDASFFGISPREAPHVDPRQRKLLEVAWEALEDAGIPPHSLAGSATSVYLATLSNDYDVMLSRNYRRFSASTGTGTANSIVANRLSYFLDLHGPSLTLDTACSGSLLAIELACRSLRSGESSMALAGGVSLNLLPKGDVFFSSAGALSPTGRCRTFDADADGIVRSEGAGVIVLKRMDDAIADGDRIYAVIKGGAVNHDGSSNGIMAPNGEAQKRVLREAYKNAGIAPGAVQYVEAHGTGTPLGDPIEVSALSAIMGEQRNGTPLVLGSLKTNVGHMEAAAGVAGVIKVALAMHHEILPPNCHFQNWNPRISRPTFAMEVRSELSEWPDRDHPRLAGVSGFSFGGTNAHLVMQEAPQHKAAAPTDHRNFILPLSAKSPDSLRETINDFARFLEVDETSPALRDICYTAGVGRSHHPYRLAVGGTDAKQLRAQLTTRATTGKQIGKLAFVFAGQGSHWTNMGDSLYRAEPVFRQTMETCDRLFASHTGWSVIAEVSSGARLDETDISQAAVFSMQVALAALWRSWGIQPDAVVGQSLGEVAAAYVAGALSLESAVAVVHHRSRTMKTVSGRGKTAVVALSRKAAEEILAAWSGDLHIAGSSGPETCVVAGTPTAVDAFVAHLADRDIFGRAIPGIDVAFHSPQMQLLRGELELSLADTECRTARTAMMSTVTGQWLNGTKPDHRYWGRNLCEPFQLGKAIEALLEEGFDGFLEIGPGSLLAGPIRQTVAAKGADAVILGSLQRDETGAGTMLSSLAVLYSAGREVNWAALYPEPANTVSLPMYRWQRVRYWMDQLPGGPDTSGDAAEGHPLLGKHTESALPDGQRFWERDFDVTSLHYLSGHKVLGSTVFPGAGYLEAAMAAMRQTQAESRPIEITNLRFLEQLALSSDTATRLQLAFSPAPGGRYTFRFSARQNGSSAWSQLAAGSAGSILTPAEVSGLQQARSRCTESIEARLHYAAMGAQGLEYGDHFRPIRQIWRGPNEAVGELVLPDASTAEAHDYCVHPLLIDGALQTVAAAMAPAEGDVYSTESYLPHAIGHARFYATPGDRATCIAHLRSGSAGDEELHADIRLLNANGQVCLEIDDLVLKHVGSKQAGARGKLRDWLYNLSWEAAPRPPAEAALQTRSWAILADAGGFGNLLADELRQRGADCVLVSPGAFDVEHHLPTANSGIVYLCGLDDQADPCISLLDIVNTLARNRSDGVPLWIVTRETQPAGGRMPVLSSGAQLWGFGKVLALEHPEIWGGLADLGSDEDTRALADELLAPTDERQLAFHHGTRYVARLTPAHPVARLEPTVFHPDATYLITGGLGGLGLALARWMAEHGARRFILMGRTALPPRSEWRALAADHVSKSKVEAILDLERSGASVHLAAVDVSDPAQVKTWVDAFHAEGWPHIRGVIHAAGVVDDQLMLRLDHDSFQRVLQPKVAGTLALHEATMTLNLDFFTLFSSVSSVLGQFGQAHYAAGNAFMDHLAHWRRAQGLPATTINWGPWSEIGLYARSGVTEKTGRSGVFPMLPNQALQAMEHIHALSPAQAVVVSADWSRMPPSPLLTALAPPGLARTSEDSEAAASLLLNLLLAEPDDRRKRLEEVLCTAAASVLGLEVSRLDIREPLTSFGMDSIMVVELRNYIEKTMNLSLSMVDLFTGSVTKLAEQLADKLADSVQLEELLNQVENMSPEQIQTFLGEESESLRS